MRRNDQLKLLGLLVVPAIIIGLLLDFYFREEELRRYRTMLGSSNKQEQRYGIEGLVRGCFQAGSSGELPTYFSARLYGNCSTVSNANLSEADLSRANLSGANLSGANLYRVNLSRADLSRADLSRVNLSGADLSRANLSRVNLSGANLSGADLSETDLSEVILIATDLRDTKLLSIQLLGGEGWSPLLCNVALPKAIKVDSNRDCDRIPQELQKRYPQEFKTLQDAKEYVDDLKTMQH